MQPLEFQPFTLADPLNNHKDNEPEAVFSVAEETEQLMVFRGKERERIPAQWHLLAASSGDSPLPYISFCNLIPVHGTGELAAER